MKSLNRLHVNPARFLAILTAAVSYIVLVITDALVFFPDQPPGLLSWARFGFSAFVSLSFLAVGSVVWLFARERRVALLLWCFCLSMMATFAVQTAAASDMGNTSLLSVVSHTCSALSLAFLSMLLLVFPYNYFSARDHRRRTPHVLRVYLATLLILSVLVGVYAGLTYIFPGSLSDWLHTILQGGYYALALVGILVSIGVSYRRAPSMRVRQKQRILVGGIVLSFAPLLILTIIPLTLKWAYAVDGQLSTVTLGFLPLALGYSILRDQLLVFDRLLQRIVAFIVGVFALALLGYFGLAAGLLLRTSGYSVGFAVSSAIALMLLGPWLWSRAGRWTERLFFSEIAHYRRRIEQPDLLTRESLDVSGASQLISVAAGRTFETEEVCLFVLEGAGRYRLFPPLGDQDASPRSLLLTRLFQGRGTLFAFPERSGNGCGLWEGIDYLHVADDTLEKLSNALRPFFLSELNQQATGGLARYIATTSPAGEHDPLIAPVLVQAELVGILVLGKRGDGQNYTVTDFEVIQLIVDRYSAILETARLHQQARQQQERINRELLAANERQQELNRLKDQFIMTASHELRTPLTAVQGYIELLETHNEKLPSERRAEFITKAHRGCDELTLLVENIMDASRLHIDTEHLNLTRVLLGEPVMHITEMLEGMTRSEQRAILVSIPADAYVMADELRLRQVLLNLVNNALKYSPPHSDVAISAEVGEGTVCLMVRDHGLGVPPEEQEHLFERFYRLERDLNSPVRGAGLGLYISKRLIEAMGGSIWMHSEGTNKGSTFSFALKRPVLDQRLDTEQAAGQVAEG